MNILEARRRVLGGEVYKKTAEGNPVSVRSLARMRPGLNVYGKSTQQTTTGAQLIPFELGTEIVSKTGLVRCIPKEDGFYMEAGYGVAGTAENDIYFVGNANSTQEVGYGEYENLSAGDYRAVINSMDFRFYVVVWRNRSEIIFDSLNQSLNKGFTVQDGDKFRIFLRPTNSATKSGVVQAIISKQNTELMYEPYTGGKPSPSPDYPQEIENVGDNGSIQVDVTGANICPETQRVNVNIEETGNMSHYGYSGFIPVVPGEKYSINTSMIVKYFDESKEGVRSKQESIITPNENEKYIKIGTVLSAASLGDDFKIMINAGESLFPYEPYKQPQSLTVQTPNGLPGIPVSSGGNYTDENGQQWVCDEIDYARGKYVKRVAKYVPAEQMQYITNGGAQDTSNTILCRFYTKINPNPNVGCAQNNFVSKVRSDIWNADEECWNFQSDGSLDFRINKDRLTEVTLEAAKQFCSEIGAYFYYALGAPIETNLTEEQLQAYVNLHTNRPTTIVSATDNAGIKLTYKTKKSLEVTD